MEPLKTVMVTSEDQHWYQSRKYKGVYFPSVTTVLGECFPKGVGFSKYLAAQASWESSQETLKAAGKRGTNVHHATEKLERGEMLEMVYFTEEEWIMLQGFVAWYKEYNPRALYIELPLVSDKYKTGGTIDRVYKIGEDTVLLDIKTSSSIYPSYWCQAGTYATLFKEIIGVEVNMTAILRLTDRKKSRFEYQVHSREEWKEDFKIFQATQKLWNHMNPKAQPKILELPLTLSLKKQ